jgi:hypothetical protein
MDLSFPLAREHLGYFLPDGQFRIDPGLYQFGVGFDATIPLDGVFHLAEG